MGVQHRASPRAQAAGPPAAARALGTRRSTGHLLLGAGLVVVCALAFAVTGLRADRRVAVLAVATAVPAGHVLDEADLSVVRISAVPALGVVPQSQRGAVLGHRVRLPLAAHALLDRAVLGPADWPPAGQALVAVAVKAGHAPAGLTPGAQVTVVVVPATLDAAGGARGGPVVQVPAAVYAVAGAGAADAAAASMVVTLLADAQDATRIATAVGDVALVVRAGVG